MYRSWLLACSAVALIASCGGDGSSLLVDVRTDLVPGREFASVRTEVSRGDTERELGTATAPANTSGDWGRGVRVAELRDLESGPIAMRVVLLDASGAEVLSRRVRFTLEGTRGVTVVFARACTSVVCPAPGDDPGATECLGDRCVPPECTVEDDATCGTAECEADDDCSAAAACTRPRCIGGACLAVPDDTLCGSETWCHPTRGCVADLGDASVADAGIDGGASDASTGCTGGCDDGNPCTDDACAGGSCTHTSNTASCDDGVFCNGIDTCAAGACVSAGDPCSGGAICDEPSATCVGCVSDTDCPADSFGAWTACGSFADTCDQTGTRSRGVTSWECVSMTCTPTTSTAMGSCTRTTDGVGCASTTYGTWGACGSFADTCDESGTRSRTVTDYACSGGACAPSASTEMETCTRDTDGTSCGATMYGAWGACGSFASTCDETGTRSRSVTTYACASASCAATTGSESEACTRDTDGVDCTRGFEFPCHVTRCSSGLCSVVGDTCGTGICCEFGCQPMGTLCP